MGATALSLAPILYGGVGNAYANTDTGCGCICGTVIICSDGMVVVCRCVACDCDWAQQRIGEEAPAATVPDSGENDKLLRIAPHLIGRDEEHEVVEELELELVKFWLGEPATCERERNETYAREMLIWKREETKWEEYIEYKYMDEDKTETRTFAYPEFV
jgi:hypothetical protein